MNYNDAPANIDEYIARYKPSFEAAFSVVRELKEIQRIDRTNFDHCIYAGMFQIVDAEIKGYYFLDVSIQVFETHVDIIMDILDSNGNELYVQALRYSHTFVACHAGQIARNVHKYAVHNLLKTIGVQREYN